jgi:hypothetical protein
MTPSERSEFIQTALRVVDDEYIRLPRLDVTIDHYRGNVKMALARALDAASPPLPAAEGKDDAMECPHCDGHGTCEGGPKFMFSKCRTCEGTGVVSRAKYYGPGSGSHTREHGYGTPPVPQPAPPQEQAMDFAPVTGINDPEKLKRYLKTTPQEQEQEAQRVERPPMLLAISSEMPPSMRQRGYFSWMPGRLRWLCLSGRNMGTTCHCANLYEVARLDSDQAALAIYDSEARTPISADDREERASGENIGHHERT